MNNLFKWIIRPLPYKMYRRSAVIILIGITIFGFILQRFIPDYFLALNTAFIVQKGFIWTLVTYMFTHGGFFHMFFNMLVLYFFGLQVERTWGSSEFMFMYFLFGIGAGLFTFLIYLMTGATYVFLIGASGAVFGIMLVFACLYPRFQIYIFGVFPITARVFMLIYIALQLFSLGGGSRSGVAYLTHLGGVTIAWLYLLIRHKINPYKKLFFRR